jgi:hypothetical protein
LRLNFALSLEGALNRTGEINHTKREMSEFNVENLERAMSGFRVHPNKRESLQQYPNRSQNKRASLQGPSRSSSPLSSVSSPDQFHSLERKVYEIES